MGWLAAQAFYPGIADRLRTLLRDGVRIVIITTKEGRFAHMLLEANGVTLPAAHVWGKEKVRPKAELLRFLRQEHAVDYGDLWFVEDRLKTLRAVRQQGDLEPVRLFLATWGYNTPAERDEAAADRWIVPLSLAQFCGNLSAWTPERADDTEPSPNTVHIRLDNDSSNRANPPNPPLPKGGEGGFRQAGDLNE
jgi:histidinol phosphatase-like enzyme